MAYRLKIKQKQWLVIIHVITVISWFGGVIGMLTFGLSLLYAENGQQLYYTLMNLHLIDETLIKYPALAVLLTGILLSVWTQWGLFKHYWVVIKLVLTLVIIGIGIFYLSDWLNFLLETAQKNHIFSSQLTTFQSVGWKLLGGTIFNLLAMFFMTIITYLKPFGKIKKQQKNA
jgi:uncharacterized membrane protein